MHNCLPAGMVQNWQFSQVCGAWFNSSPNQKRVRFHLCLLHFLFLTSSRRNWNWQGNYHFTLNWSQSMWAGSKHGDTRGGKKRDGGEKKKKKKKHSGSIWRWFSHLQDVSLEGWRGMEGEAGKGKKEGETFGDCVAGVPLMSPWQEPDWEPRGVGALAFYSSGSAGFFLAWEGPGSETPWPTHGASL